MDLMMASIALVIGFESLGMDGCWIADTVARLDKGLDIGGGLQE
jgi:hypothetical protein